VITANNRGTGVANSFLVTIPATAMLVVVSALAARAFLWIWKDLLFALIYVRGTPQVATMAATIPSLTRSLGHNRQRLTAAGFASMLLPFVVFFALRQYFI